MRPAELKQQVTRLLMYLSFGVKRCEDREDLTSLCPQKTKTSLFQLWNSLCLLLKIGYAACPTSSMSSSSPFNNNLIKPYKKRQIDNGVLLTWKAASVQEGVQQATRSGAREEGKILCSRLGEKDKCLSFTGLIQQTAGSAHLPHAASVLICDTDWAWMLLLEVRVENITGVMTACSSVCGNVFHL